MKVGSKSSLRLFLHRALQLSEMVHAEWSRTLFSLSIITAR